VKRVLLIGAIIALVPLATGPVAEADGGGGHDRTDVSKKLRRSVKLKNIRKHQQKFQEFADASDGTRASGTVGYDKSANYIAKKMRKAGYDVEVQEFNFDFFQQTGPSSFEQVTPDAVSYVDQTDYDVQQYSGSGDTGVQDFVGIDLALGADPWPADPSTSTSGCEAADFESPAASVAGKIAVLQRGACAFADKAVNAEAAGAVGVVIFNQGTPDRLGLFFGTLGGPVATIPVVSTTYGIGSGLATSNATGRIVTETISETRTTSNVIAQSKFGDPDNVVMAGAHLDSVPEGPGVHDNGSGSAAILEIALKLANRFYVNDLSDWNNDGEPGKFAEGDDEYLDNAVRFAWWGAEESGLLGSIDYVVNLPQEELDKIGVYLNFDMIGSPNFVRFVYDGDNSEGNNTIVAPPGSDVVEQVWLDYFDSQGLPTESTVIGQRSDHFAFCVSEIPCGGLFTGAEGLKTAEQVAVYGGTEGEQYDPCYHQACDTFDNSNNEVLDQMSDAAAHAIATFAYELPTDGTGGALHGGASGGGGGHTHEAMSTS